VLIGTISAGGPPFSGGGNLGAGLGPQASSSALQVALGTGTAGIFRGTANLALASHDSQLTDLALATSPLLVSAQVNNYAALAFLKVSCKRADADARGAEADRARGATGRQAEDVAGHGHRLRAVVDGGAAVAMPVPSDWNCTVAVPLLAPAEELPKVTLSPVLLVSPAASPLTDPPEPVMSGVVPLIAASRFSEKPSLAAVLVTLRLPESAVLMRTLPRLTGLVALPVAKRKTLPVTVMGCD